jgi:hypothetical protein
VDREREALERKDRILAHMAKRDETAAELRQQAMWAGMSKLMGGFEGDREMEEGRKKKAYVGGFVRGCIKTGVKNAAGGPKGEEAKKVTRSPGGRAKRELRLGDDGSFVVEGGGGGEEGDSDGRLSPQDKMIEMRERLKSSS